MEGLASGSPTSLGWSVKYLTRVRPKNVIVVQEGRSLDSLGGEADAQAMKPK